MFQINFPVFLHFSPIGYFADTSSSLKTEYMKVTDQLRESVAFGHTSNKEILDKYGYKEWASFIDITCFAEYVH